ncbi:phosphoribosylformylglycinamidine synthase subunit PurQ [Verrucomicrobiota bacterium]
MNCKKKPPVLIITGYGVNCEAESKAAWEMAGAHVSTIHLHDLLDNPDILCDFKALMFIGGFSFGDHMGSGLVLALRLKQHMQHYLQRFIENGHLVLGICNGFQVMVKIGLLPGLGHDYFTQKISLMQNECGTFQNFWVNVSFEPDCTCVFTHGLETMPLPIRHGEGKIFTTDKRILEQIETSHCVACRYVDSQSGKRTMKFPNNPNGSLNAIAGMCDPTGRIFALMPHPEAYLFPENHPDWQRQKLNGTLPERGLGLKIFQNAVEYLT